MEHTQEVDRCPSHTRIVFSRSDFAKIAQWASEQCAHIGADAIVACGHSGLVLAGAVGLLTDLPVFAVRKKGEENHCIGSSGLVSGVAPHGPVSRWVWLDDFLSSGGTLHRSARRVYDAGLATTPVPAALLLYNCYRNNDYLSEKYERERWERDFESLRATFRRPHPIVTLRYQHRNESK